MGLADTASHDQAGGGGQHRHQNHDERQQADVFKRDAGISSHHQPRHGHDDASRDQRLGHARHNFFDHQPAHVHGGEKTVFDFLRHELDDHRHGDRLNSAHHHDGSHDPRQQSPAISGGHRAAADHQLPEDQHDT